jgi:hypothetical protein
VKSATKGLCSGGIEGGESGCLRETGTKSEHSERRAINHASERGGGDETADEVAAC